MNWVLHEIKEKSFLSPSQEPYFLFQSPPPPFPSSEPSSFNLNNRVSPSILLIIIILAIIFFISGLLHLLVRLLFSPPNREPDEYENSTVLHGQLQQLFNLHDAGVDQSFIDNLPVFNYKEIIGLKDPFDCAVCLCEFEGEDKLRLLPKCSHAFHMDCIDTWLLSHSTCPLCRACLLYDFSGNSNFSPFVLVLESGSQSVREIVPEREVARVNSHLSVHCDDQDFRLAHEDLEHKSDEIQEKGEKVVSVKLGKFRSVDNNEDEGGSSEGNGDARRCFSMGSYAYVMDENSSLQVPIRTPMKKQSSKKTFLPLQPDHKRAISECGCDSRREFNGIDAFKFLDIQGDSKSIGRSKIGSFSLSKIWSRAKKDEANESSKRAFSFRFGLNRNMTASDESKNKNGGVGSTRTISEINISRWENGGSEIGFDDEIQSIDSQENPPTFAKRTLGWFIGRQNKVVHSSFSSNNV